MDPEHIDPPNRGTPPLAGIYTNSFSIHPLNRGSPYSQYSSNGFRGFGLACVSGDLLYPIKSQLQEKAEEQLLEKLEAPLTEEKERKHTVSKLPTEPLESNFINEKPKRKLSAEEEKSGLKKKKKLI